MSSKTTLYRTRLWNRLAGMASVIASCSLFLTLLVAWWVIFALVGSLLASFLLTNVGR